MASASRLRAEEEAAASAASRLRAEEAAAAAASAAASDQRLSAEDHRGRTKGLRAWTPRTHPELTPRSG